jgi:hypothetical protein
MIRSEFQDFIRVLLAEKSGNSAITDPNIDDMINSVMPFVSIAAKLLTFRTIDTVVGTDRYSLPSDFLKMQNVYLQVDANRREKLIYRSRDQFEALSFGASAQQAEPEYYTIELGRTSNTDDTQPPGDIGLYPVPNTVITDGIVIRYFQRCDDMSADTESPELFVHAHTALAYRVAMNLAFKLKDRALAADLNALYEQEILEHKKLMASDQDDGPFSTIDVMGYSDYQW